MNIGRGMNRVVKINPESNGDGFVLRFESTELWYASEVHAINYANVFCKDCDIVVYRSDGSVKHRYSAPTDAVRTDRTLTAA
jgi:hypothetical protein